MENFLIIIFFMLIGIALKLIPQFSKETGNVLNLFVIYVSLPAIVLLKITELTFSLNLLAPVLICWVVLLISSGVILILTNLFKWERQITGCLLLLVPLGNTSFLGIPMVEAFFGERAVTYALLYDQPGSFLALATYGSIIIAFFGNDFGKPVIKDIAKKVITFPPFIALIIAFALNSITYPVVVVNILETLEATLIPLVMIAVGFQISLRIRKEEIAPLTIGLTIKLIAAPIFALLFCRLIGLKGEAVQVSIFEAGMPPMVSAGALAIMAGLSPSLAAALVGLGLILSFITLPILFYLI